LILFLNFSLISISIIVAIFSPSIQQLSFIAISSTEFILLPLTINYVFYQTFIDLSFSISASIPLIF